MSGNKLQPTSECCICGDYGLTSELFWCKVCQFRSQHRYCSNLYPKEESYQLCNWCLSHDTKKSQSFWNSSSSNKTYNGSDSKSMKINQGGPKSQRSVLSLQMNGPIKKPKSSETPPSTRRRLITDGKLEEMHSGTRSETLSKSKTNGIIKQVYRNKVRRYKLLDEMSSL